MNRHGGVGAALALALLAETASLPVHAIVWEF